VKVNPTRVTRVDKYLPTLESRTPPYPDFAGAQPQDTYWINWVQRWNGSLHWLCAICN